jgi:hypothetical protein
MRHDAVDAGDLPPALAELSGVDKDDLIPGRDVRKR